MVCISEEDKAAMILNESVKEFEAAVKVWKSDHKTAATDAFTGAVLGYAAFNQFKKGLPACENIEAKIAQLPQMKNFHPKVDSLTKVDFHQMQALPSAYEKQDWFTAGKDFGKMMKSFSVQQTHQRALSATQKSTWA